VSLFADGFCRKGKNLRRYPQPSKDPKKDVPEEETSFFRKKKGRLPQGTPGLRLGKKNPTGRGERNNFFTGKTPEGGEKNSLMNVGKGEKKRSFHCGRGVSFCTQKVQEKGSHQIA